MSTRLEKASRRHLIVANWKMNGSRQSNAALLAEFTQLWAGEHKSEVVICAPYIYIDQVANTLCDSAIIVGAQDLSQYEVGAYTGEVSAQMLRDNGCGYAIVGHSERRNYFQESNDLIVEKFIQAQKAGLIPIFCVGESLERREAGEALIAIGLQLQSIIDVVGQAAFRQAVVAYEPIWAVGTGRIATPEQVEEVHGFIRAQFGEVGSGLRILYGGSVKPENAAQTFALDDVDGALIGGASLQAKDFYAICQAAE